MDLTKLGALQEKMQAMIVERWKGRILSTTLANDVAKSLKKKKKKATMVKMLTSTKRKNNNNKTSHLCLPFNKHILVFLAPLSPRLYFLEILAVKV